MKNITLENVAGACITLALLLAVMVFTALPALAGVPVECSEINAAADSDGDGFTDSDTDPITTYGVLPGESAAFMLPSGLTVADPASYADTGAETVTMDAAVPDLFVMVFLDESTSILPEDVLSYTEADTAAGGLGINVHYLLRDPSFTSRDITTCQKAITLTEDETPYVPPGRKQSLILGVTSGGDPNGLDSTTVYTRRIEGFILDLCGSYHDNCVSSTGIGNEALRDLYIKYVANHEVGHTVTLADVPADYIDLYNGKHQPPGEMVMLEQQAVYTKKGSKVTFYLTDVFDDSDRAARTLHTY